VQKLPDALRRQRFGACELRVGFGIDKTGASQKELKHRFAGDVRTDFMPGRDGAGKESRVFSAGRLEAAVFQTRMKGMLKALPVNLDGFDGFRESLKRIVRFFGIALSRSALQRADVVMHGYGCLGCRIGLEWV